MEHPKKIARAYDVAELRDKLERTRLLIPEIEERLRDAEAAYGDSLNGLLAGVARVWKDIQGVHSEVTKLVNNAPKKPAKAKKG